MYKLKVKKSNPFEYVEIKVCDNHPHAYKPHLHSELSVGVVQKGSTHLEVKNKTHIISEGEGIIILPYTVHNCQPVNIDNWAFSMLYVQREIFDTSDIFKGKMQHDGILKIDSDSCHKVMALIKNLDGQVDRFSNEVDIIDTLNTIAYENIEYIDSNLNHDLNRIRKYLDKHFLENLNLERLESLFQWNRYTLIRKFKSEFNTTPSAYQLLRKADYAKQLLKSININSPVTLADVAIQAGFYDQSHFNREFKKSFGLTPNQYRDALNSCK